MTMTQLKVGGLKNMKLLEEPVDFRGKLLLVGFDCKVSGIDET